MKSKLYLKLSLIAALYSFISTTNAQVNLYTFSQGTFNSQWIGIGDEVVQLGYPGNVTPTNNNPLKVIYAGNNAAGSTALTDSGSGYPIGFNFIYDGEIFDRVVVSGNGYIKLGNSSQSITLKNDTIAGTIFNGDSYHKNIIAAFETNASIFNTELPVYSYGTINIGNAGLPGNRVFIAQYDYGVYINGGANLVLIDFQIQLFENDNSVRIAYKTFYNSSTLSTQGAIGIVDKQGNFSSRKVTNGVNTWPTSVAGNSASDLCDFTSSFGPQGSNTQNLMYIWTAPSPVPSAPTCPEAYILVGPYYPDGVGYGGGNFYTPLNNAINIPTNAVINWSDISVTSHQATTYDVYLDTDNPPLMPVAQNLTTTSYTTVTLAPKTKYYYNIVASNALGKDSMCIGSFTTDSVPQYCNVGLPGNYFINTLTLNATSFVLPGNYTQVYVFPSTGPYTTILKRDTSYTCSVIMGSSTPSGPWSRANVSVFIDFNHDGDFDDPGENIVGGSAMANGSLAFSIPIPITALLGNTVMRIRSKDVAQITPITACDPDAGIQDFIITIGPASGCETLRLDPAVNDVNCYGQSNGDIILNTSGGTTPYNISWTNGSSTDQIPNLTKGIYKATVIDANGCEVATSLMPVLQPAALSIDTARDSNNSIHVLISGGTAPYNYLWSNDSTSSDPNNFTAGTYSVKVTDAHGCDTTMRGIVISATTIIPPPPPPPVDSVTVMDSSININVYPNPNSGTIYLKSQKQQYAYIQIISEQGKEMNEGNYTISNIAVPINITTYPAGIYFLKIIGDKSTKVIKILKVINDK